VDCQWPPSLLPTSACDRRTLPCSSSSTTPTTMPAADQVAAIRSLWPTALEALKCIPAAAADKTLPLTDLHEKASAAELDSSMAVKLTAGHANRDAGRPGFAPDARKVLVDELKVGGPWQGPRGAIGTPGHC